MKFFFAMMILPCAVVANAESGALLNAEDNEFWDRFLQYGDYDSIPQPVAPHPAAYPTKPTTRPVHVPSPHQSPVMSTCTKNTDCSDNNVCNGKEICDTTAGICKKGQQLVCDDNNLCTIDTCDTMKGCIHTSVACGVNEACNLRNGACVNASAVRPCIAVIDESSIADSAINTRWNTFRTNWPDRPFCLLQPLNPNPSLQKLFLPTSPDFISDPLNTFMIVNRDNGDESLEEDWLRICGYTNLRSVEFIGLFVDTSGSMPRGTVQASMDKLDRELAAVGLTYCTVPNPAEDWISPFNTLLGTVGGGAKCDVP